MLAFDVAGGTSDLDGALLVLVVLGKEHILKSFLLL